MPRSEPGWDARRKTGRSCPSGTAAAGGAGRCWHLGTVRCWSSGSDLCHTWQWALPPRPCLAQLCCVLKFESDAIFDCCFTSVGEAGMAFGFYTDGLYSAAQLKGALDKGVMQRRLRWAFGAEHPTAHSLFHPDGSTQLDRGRMEKETAAHISPGKPAGTEQHFIAAASLARAPRGARAQGWAWPQPGAGTGGWRELGPGQGTDPPHCPWPSCHPCAQHHPAPGRAVGKRSCPPTALGYGLPHCERPACPRAAGCQEGLLQLRPQPLRTRLCLRDPNLRWFGNVNEGCDGLRGSSCAAELRARAAQARGAGGWNLPGRLPRGWAG